MSCVPERASQKPSRPSSKATGDAFDPMSRLLRVFSPAIEQLQQGILVDLVPL
jgi:hypothetical protein